MFTYYLAVVVGFAPATLIIASLICVFNYHMMLSTSVSQLNFIGTTASVQEILPKVPLWKIPYGEALILWYLGIFVFAEAAFIMMALREYLQDLLKIEEMELIYPYLAYKDRELKTLLRRAIAHYRKTVTVDNRTYADFLDYLAVDDLHLIDAINRNHNWQREIHDELTRD